MATTMTRRLRRRITKQKAEEIEGALYAYQRDQSTMLRVCHEKFGRPRFESVLGHYLFRQPIMSALRSTFLFLFAEDQNGKTS